MTTIGEALDNNTLHREDQWGTSAVTIGQALDRGWITEDMPAPAKPKPDKLDAAGIDPVQLVGGPENAKKIREAFGGYRGGDPGADAEADRAEWAAGTSAVHDAVNHPSHYTGFSNGAEVIDITENLTFNRGNAVKYLARAGAKDPAKELEDLHKAAWYVAREIQRLEKGTA